MRKWVLMSSIFLLFGIPAFTQEKVDSLTDEMKGKIFTTFKHFTFRFYVDTYINLTLDNKKDTSNLIPYSSNCPVRDQIRINHAALEFYYDAEKVRGKAAIQWGDAPNLLASTDAQFIKSIRQANFGFRIIKNLWIDFGYMFNPVGYESAWAIINQISTVTVGGYFEPGSVLGVKLSCKFSEKFSGGVMTGNSYSLAYGRNTHMAGMIFLVYQPRQNLSIGYYNFFGNQALRNAELKNDILYNNFVITYNPVRPVQLVGQFDISGQTNSGLKPDTTKSAWMYSGFIQAGYIFNPHFSLYARYEFFNDPNGFLSGPYKYDNKTTGLLTRGFTASFEYKPVKIGYLRLSYRYLHANEGNNVFYSGLLDHINILTFTTGVRF
jgi:hypothetical protein